MQKVSIVTGLRGQAGSILAESLLNDGHKVYGLIRRASHGRDLGNAKGLEGNPNLEVVEGDITDLSSMTRLFSLAKADYCLSMASQSHVAVSFEQPIYTAMATGLGTLNCLEAIRLSGIHTRFLNASSSELFGGISTQSCNEETPFHPRSPYAVSKAFSHHMVVNYRESYKIFACNAICFNYEGCRRGPEFVTRKITLAVAKIKAGRQVKLFLGNLEAKRDWSSAYDTCRGMRLILEEANQPDDFVLASGEAHSVREFCDLAFRRAGMDYREFVEVDPRFYRPAEVNVLLGDSTKIRTKLGWRPTTSFEQLVCEMVDHDLQQEGVTL